MVLYAGNDNWPTNADLVEGGYQRNAGSVRVGDEAALDRTTWLRNRMQSGVDGELVRFPLLVLPSTAPIWEGNATGGGPFGLVQSDATSAFTCVLELTQPKAVTLTDLSVTLVGTGGHAALPGTMPRLQLYRQDCSTLSAPVSVADVPDGSATTAAYQALHLITIPTITEVLDPAGIWRYYVFLVGEAGANAIAGLTVVSLHGHTDTI